MHPNTAGVSNDLVTWFTMQDALSRADGKDLPWDSHQGQPISHSRIAPRFVKMAQNLDSRCVLISDPSTLGAGAKPRLHTPKAVTYHEQPHYCRFMIGHSLEVDATMCLQAHATGQSRFPTSGELRSTAPPRSLCTHFPPINRTELNVVGLKVQRCRRLFLMTARGRGFVMMSPFETKQRVVLLKKQYIRHQQWKKPFEHKPHVWFIEGVSVIM